MSSPIAFRFTNETVADMDMIAARLGCDRKEAVRLALADYRAKVTGVVSASAVEPPPPAVASSIDPPPYEPGIIPDGFEVAVYRSDVPSPPSPVVATDERPRAVASTPPVIQAQRPPQPVKHVGPVQCLRRVPPTIPDLPNVHRLKNPVTRAREQGR